MAMMKFMPPLTIVFLVLLVRKTLFSAVADKQLIENTCKATPSYDLCFSVLSANPKSQNADLTGLALIMVDALKVKGEQTILQINTLSKSRPELRPALTECGSVYNAVVKVDVKEAVDALTLGDPKFGEDGMADAAVESQACEMSFGHHNLTSPMTETNQAMADLANVARAIIHMLL